MFGQEFSPGDLASVAFLVLLEALLSADNALVLAILVKHLPKGLQQKALLYGLGGAFVFRLIAIVFAAIILKQWWLQALGAAYLIYLPLKHFHHKATAGGPNVKLQGTGFWATVVAVELTDIAFALDSVLAGIGFISTRGKIATEKIWVVYLGAVIGIVLLRFAAGIFVRLLERFPSLDHVAYLLVGWVGVKLAFHASEKGAEIWLPDITIPHLTDAMFWIGLLTIAVTGTVYAVRIAPRKQALQSGEAGQLPPQ